jgi:hypothetical protein
MEMLNVLEKRRERCEGEERECTPSVVSACVHGDVAGEGGATGQGRVCMGK